MTTLSLSGIAGTDGIVPVYEPDARWTIWSLDEIFVGQQGAGRYVPKINDYVIDIKTDEKFIAVDIDPTTMIATLRKVQPIVDGGDFTEQDLLLGVGPGTQSDTYRVYIDTTVMPHTLSVDARLKVAGTMVASAKIFKGSELTGNEKVISAFYDQTGNLLGQSIPLELVAMPNGQNMSIRSVPVCYTTEKLKDGEILTVVFYSDTGHVVSKRQLLAENTGFIRSSDASVKYITGISLESPFLSSADPTLIQYPLNVPLQSLSLMGVVHYSDGSKLRMPVDGTKFSIFGFRNFVATIVSQKIPLVLKYVLSPGEIAYGTTVVEDHHISATYHAITVKADGAYTVKLFGFPVWVDAVNGYRMEWFLYNLDRNKVYKATPYVKFNANTKPFDSTAYGVNQKLSVSVNLKDINGLYASYIHVQTIDITLLAPGTDRTTNWTIGFEPGQNPPFGRDNFADLTFVNQNLRKIKVGLGATSQTEWLDRLFYMTRPLVDESKEALPPAPNYFSIVTPTAEVEFPIAQWNNEQVLTQVVNNNDTLFLKFFKRTADNDLQLAIAGLPVYQKQ